VLLKLELDLVRHVNNVIAAKVKYLGEGRYSLKMFLFYSDKKKDSILYQDAIS